MNNHTYTDPAAPGTSQNGHLGYSPPQAQGSYIEAPSHQTSPNLAYQGYPPLSPAYDSLFDSPGHEILHHSSPSQPQSHHNHMSMSNHQTPAIQHYPSPFQTHTHQTPPATPCQAVPRPNQDYQAMLQAMKDGNFNIPIFGATGQKFRHNTPCMPTFQEARPGDNGTPVQQNLAPGAQTRGKPTPGRRDRKRGGGVLSMLLD